MKSTIIHLDDDLQVLDLYAAAFKNFAVSSHFQMESCVNPHEFREQLIKVRNVAVFIIDLYLGNSEQLGSSLIGECRKLYPNALILISSSANDHTLIHSCLMLGADDFIPKELDIRQMVRLIERKLHTHRQTLCISNQHTTMAGTFMTETCRRIPNIIESAINCVHLFGETGTGKEIIADIFENSLPPNTPFVRVNCGAITSSLIVSEMFGHSKGAFTGAITEKRGLLEAAHNGWIFLDEVATLPLDAQAALLRAIDNQKIRRIGSTKDITVNFRVLSATNESLEDLVASGKFRRDLWQRLRETEIALPPLRERTSEITELIKYFCETMRGGPFKLAPTVMNILQKYDWRDGNVRELRNCLRSMTEKATDQLLTPTCIPERIWSYSLREGPAAQVDNATKTTAAETRLELTWSTPTRPNFETLCSMLLIKLIRYEHSINGKVSARSLARSLGIPKSSLPAKLNNIIEVGQATRCEIDNLLNGSPRRPT